MPIKNPIQRSISRKRYYRKNREKLLAYKKSLRCDSYRKKKREYDAKYRATSKGRFVRTRMSKIMTYEDYLVMKEKQKDLCAICSKKCKDGRNLSIDHCHKRNVVRGLLCNNCNLGLGKFGDDQELLQKALHYLKKSYETQ